jgi:hypothetical protein
MKRQCLSLALFGIATLGFMGFASAQQVTGVLGSPSATTTISGKQLPPPNPKFGGVITQDATTSKPWWPPTVVPSKGAPNVLLIMTDDSGFGVPSTFGGVIPTPNLDRIAKNGLRYTQFHSTALCSPTRAALITGRNHHAVGFGQVSEFATGFPGYDSVIGPENASIGRILSENGYATSWFGKNHNTPAFLYSAGGPFDQWPTGMGFQYFYGFMGGESDQWTPYLFRNTAPVFPWVGQKDYNLITDMADDAIRYMKDLDASTPDKPFLVYYVPGATHSPHHPTKEWIDKISAMKLFDQGWEKLREQIFANQKRLGVIPANTQLTPWPDVPAEVGLAVRRAEEDRSPSGRRLRRLHCLQRPRDRARDSGCAGHGQARQHAHHLHQRRQRHQPRRLDDGHAEHDDRLQRRARIARSSSTCATTSRGGRTRPTRTWRCPGPGPSTRPSNGSSRWPRTSAARARAWRSRGPAISTTSAASAPSSTT